MSEIIKIIDEREAQNKQTNKQTDRQTKTEKNKGGHKWFCCASKLKTNNYFKTKRIIWVKARSGGCLKTWDLLFIG